VGIAGEEEAETKPGLGTRKTELERLAKPAGPQVPQPRANHNLPSPAPRPSPTLSREGSLSRSSSSHSPQQAQNQICLLPTLCPDHQVCHPPPQHYLLHTDSQPRLSMGAGPGPGGRRVNPDPRGIGQQVQCGSLGRGQGSTWVCLPVLPPSACPPKGQSDSVFHQLCDQPPWLRPSASPLEVTDHCGEGQLAWSGRPRGPGARITVRIRPGIWVLQEQVVGGRLWAPRQKEPWIS
jgi:hypothetical protein